MSKPLIINFTPTGMIPTKEMTPHVPVQVNEIVEDVHEAWETGISMVHLHARDAQTGTPTYLREIYVILLEEKEDAMILRKRVMAEWDLLSKKDSERWRSFINRYDELLLDMMEEGISKTENDLYHKLIEAVGDTRRSTDVKVQG